LRNVFLTGQNLNLHGILGVSMTSVLTCMEILGRDSLSLPKLR
jgi:all-trans-retinol 13,14-reductase